MDTSPNPTYENDIEEAQVLSYDDTIPYDEQVSTTPQAEPEHSSLANRIGTTKVYLISEAVSGAVRAGKRKHDEKDDTENEPEDEMVEDADPSQRDNAILFEGSPISHLPTSNLFAYATHFDSHPIALEWIDDKTCILVFSTRAAARTAYQHLTKSHTEEPSEDGCVTAKPIPIALWPPEERINKSLGTGEGLKGAIHMRWATGLDVKKRGAKQRSKFYRKYGRGTGREGHDVENAWESGRDQKRRRKDEGEDSEALERAQLDEELEAFLAEDADAVQTASPPVESLSSRIGAKSKMRSDNMDEEGKSLLERTSDLRFHSTARPRRGRGWGDGEFGGRGDSTKRGQGRGRRGGRNERPRVTQGDLDAELDAFLNSKD